jgi:putative Holliday junction resolvase
MSKIVLRFIDDLKKENPLLIINTVDERLSSVTANKTISDLGMNHSQRKNSVDRIAACVILDTYIRMKGY